MFGVQTVRNKSMKLSLLQTETYSGNIESNLRKVECQIKGVGNTDMIVLPELFATPLCRLDDSVLNCSPMVMEWMRKVSAFHHAAVAGSVAVRDGSQVFNRLFFISPDGTEHYYDKRHAFGSEKGLVSEGSSRVVVSYGGVRFMLAVCYDLRFPVWLRNRGDYDCLLLSANWPASRIGAWLSLTQARAIENQCYVVGANSAGSDGVISYGGNSVVFDPFGRLLASDGHNKEALVEVDISPTVVSDCRKRFPVLSDADRFTIDI